MHLLTYLGYPSAHNWANLGTCEREIAIPTGGDLPASISGCFCTTFVSGTLLAFGITGHEVEIVDCPVRMRVMTEGWSQDGAEGFVLKAEVALQCKTRPRTRSATRAKHAGSVGMRGVSRMYRR